MTATSLLVWLALAAPPKAPAEADLITWLPRVDGVASVVPFFRAAGTRALLLRPEAWRERAEPLLELDLTSADSLALAGVDRTGPLTTSSVAERTLTCFTLADPKRFASRVNERLARGGTVFSKVESGVAITATRDPLDRVLNAVATSGRDACTLVGHGLSVEKQLPLLVKAVGKPLAAPGVTMANSLPGVVNFIVPQGARHWAISLSAKGLDLSADAKSRGMPFVAMAGAGPSPFAAFSPAGMLVVRARFQKSAMPMVLQQFVERLPVGGLAAPAKLLAPALSGNAALVVGHVKVTSGLRSAAARLFAVRFAVLAEASDVELARQTLDALDVKALTLREGQLDVALVGTTVILSNDAELKARALASLGAAGKQSHAVEFHASPSLVANGLSQVPLLEAVQAPELAGLVAVSAELGPLLLASERVSGWIDESGRGSHRAQLSWVLNPAKFVETAPDAGAK